MIKSRCRRVLRRRGSVRTEWNLYQQSWNVCLLLLNWLLHDGEFHLRRFNQISKSKLHFLLISNSKLDIDECENSPCVEGQCINELGSFLCVCDPGYTLERNVCIGQLIFF